MKSVASLEIAELLSVEVAPAESTAVTPTEAKLYSHIDGDLQDDVIESLIAASVEAFEGYTGKLLFQREVTAVFEGGQLLRLPWLPVDNVESVSSGAYELKGDSIIVGSTEEATVIYTAGLIEPEDKIPGDIKIGLLKWINSNFNDRDDMIAGGAAEMPNSSKSLWAKYRTASI